MGGLSSNDELGCYVRIELVVLFEADIVYTPFTVEDLERYLSSNLRLAENLDNRLHSLKYLPLDHCFKMHPTR